MYNQFCDHTHRPRTRREFLSQTGLGVGALGLASLLYESGMAVEQSASSSPVPKAPHFAAKAKRVIQIFCAGGPSHLDTFDPKPALERYHDQRLDDVAPDYVKQAGATFTNMGQLAGRLQRSAFSFARYGQSGIEISELYPRLARHADELCVVRSMHSPTSEHIQAQLTMNTGAFASVRPSLGAWTVYGLGTENQNLPGFVSLSPAASSASGDKNWGNAFLPAWSAGTAIKATDLEVSRMIEHIRSGTTSLREQRRQLDLIQQMNRDFAEAHPHEALLEGRIGALETAFRMQVEASEAFDIAREPRRMHELYGESSQGRQLLLARRLVERGVRFVQVYHYDWDTHDMNDEKLRDLAREGDQPLDALLTDLAERDMLRDTLVLWGGEFGRTPTRENNKLSERKGIGRDHNAGGFTIWMAGGGTRPGTVYGATDELAALAIENKVGVPDLHATILHLLGFDHERLTYRYAGRDFRLTDVEGHVVQGLLA